MEKKDQIIDNFKNAIKSTVRSISNIKELDVNFDVGLIKFIKKALPLTLITAILYLISIYSLNNFFELNKLNFKFDNFKIPSVSNIMKNQSLKREAWFQLKLLKAKLDEF